jgi:hypothetical protein
MKKGENLEKLVRMIQETMKDSPNTVIHSNYKIQNHSFRKREIDILIESRINDFQIKIAIECKDYDKPVPVGEIEAFSGKCSRIRGLNKKVFVSSNGYQADAINAAKDFDIELNSLDDISPNVIQHWLKIKSLKHNVVLCPSTIGVIGSTIEVSKNLPFDDNRLIYIHGEKEPKSLLNFIWSFVVKEQKTIWVILINDFMRRKPGTPIEKKINIKFEIGLKGAYFIGIDKNRYYVDKINSSVDAWLVEEEPGLFDTKIYKELDGKEKAQVVTLGLPIGERMDIVRSLDDKLSFFHTNKKGTTAKFEELFKFDRKTNKLIEIIKTDNPSNFKT